MTKDELRAKYTVAYKIIQRERRWRAHVFPMGHPKRDEKLAEMDRLLEIFTEFKDALKGYITVEYEVKYEQPQLLDVPRRADYR